MSGKNQRDYLNYNMRITTVTVAQLPFFKNKFINHKKTPL